MQPNLLFLTHACDSNFTRRFIRDANIRRFLDHLPSDFRMSFSTNVLINVSVSGFSLSIGSHRMIESEKGQR
jgi:hypothetical protein